MLCVIQPVVPVLRPTITSVPVINPVALQPTVPPSVIIPQLGSVPIAATAAHQGIVIPSLPGIIAPQNSTTAPLVPSTLPGK